VPHQEDREISCPAKHVFQPVFCVPGASWHGHLARVLRGTGFQPVFCAFPLWQPPPGWGWSSPPSYSRTLCHSERSLCHSERSRGIYSNSLLPTPCFEVQFCYSLLVNFDDDKLKLIGWSGKSFILRELGEKSQKRQQKDFTTKAFFRTADRKY